MNIEELKREAAKHGYKLIKKQECVRLLPCVCGYSRRSLWHSTLGTMYYRCNKCGFTGGESTSVNKARKAWNDAVEHVGGDAE